MKIIFQHISITNFLSVGNAPLGVMFNSGKTLIIGHNGAGKSTIIDALCFVLFNKPYRKINKAGLINTINGKGTEVWVQFTIGQHEYIVNRGIKPDTFTVTKNGVYLDQERSAIDRQNTLNDILGMNYDAFTRLIVMGSANYESFMLMKTPARREFINQLLSLSQYYELRDWFMPELRRVQNQIQKSTAVLDVMNNTMISYKEVLRDTLSASKSRLEERDRKIQELEALANPLKTRLEDLKVQLGQHTYHQMASLHVMQGKLQIEDRNRLNKIETVKEQVTAATGGNCDHCGQAVSPEHLKAYSETLEQSYRLFREKADLVEATIKEKLDQNAIYSKIEEEFESTERSLNRIEHDRKVVEASVTNVDLDTLKGQIYKLNSDIHTETETLRVQKERLAVMEMIAPLLSDKGMVSEIINSYIPEINLRVNHYLSIMGLPLEFELDSTFNETIRARGRDTFEYANFSQGERLRIDMAILFAFRDVARMQHTVSANLFILDEIMDSSMDREGIEGVMNILSTFEDTSIFVISHGTEEMHTYFDYVFRFSKMGDFTEFTRVLT